MKNLHKYILMGSLFLSIGLTSCNNDDVVVVPTADLASMNFTHEPGEGQITIKWDVPAENPGFMYMTMVYTDPRDKVTKTKTISPYTEEIVIPETRARYKDSYSFTFTPYSETNTPGQSFTLDKCSSLAAPATTTVEKIKLSLADVTTNAAEPSEGPLANLTDGNTSNFFHTAWSVDKGDKHWVDLDLGEEVTRFEIHTWNRNGGSNHPKEVKLYRLSSMDDNSIDMENGYFYQYTHPATAAGAEAQVMYPAQNDDEMSQPVRYLRYYAKSSATFWHLAEMEINKVIVHIYDPETDETEVE